MSAVNELSVLSSSDVYEADSQNIWYDLGAFSWVPMKAVLSREGHVVLTRLFKAAYDYFGALAYENPDKSKEAYNTLRDKIDSIFQKSSDEAYSEDSDSYTEETCEECNILLHEYEVGPLCYSCIERKDYNLKVSLMKKGIPCKNCYKKYTYDKISGSIICLCSLN